MSGLAIGRLAAERKNWRKDYPEGFYARPIKKADNSTDMMIWEAGIPGKTGTDWEGGMYRVILEFSEEYPTKVRIDNDQFWLDSTSLLFAELNLTISLINNFTAPKMQIFTDNLPSERIRKW